jgi:hypothetical protein
MNDTAIRYGLVLAAIGIISQLAIYTINVELMTDMTSGIIMLLINIAIIIYFALQLRKARGGFATFGEMFGDIFIMLAISALIGTVFNYILFNFIDPELSTTIKNLTIKNTEAMLTKFGMSGEQVDAALAEIEKQDMSMTIGKSVQQLAISGIMYAIIAAIMAAILKKSKPEEVF